MLEHVKSMRDSLDLLKRYLENPGESVNITMLKELVKACSDSHNYLFEESTLVNSTGEEEKKYLKFIDQKKKEGHSVVVLAKTKDQYVMVGGMAPEDLAYFINVLMKCKDVAKYALMAKMKEKEDVYSIPGVKEIEDQFINGMMSNDTKSLDAGRDILASASEEIRELDLDGNLNIEDRRKGIEEIIRGVLANFKQMGLNREPSISDSLKRIFEKASCGKMNIEEEDNKKE